VPHLSESLLIGIERWRFVEGDVNELASFVNRSFRLDRQSFSAVRGYGRVCAPRPAGAGLGAAAIKSAEVLSQTPRSS
jgi:hypothetical protein